MSQKRANVRHANVKSAGAKKPRKENQNYDKIIRTFTIAIFAIVYLMAVYRFYSRGTTLLGTRNFLFIMSYVGAGGTLLGIVLAAVPALRNRQISKGRLKIKINGIMIAVFFAALGLGDWFMAIYFLDAVQILWIVVPVVAGLYIIYVCYQREFFIISFLSGIGMLFLWFLSKSGFDGVAEIAGWTVLGNSGNTMWRPYQFAAIILMFVLLAAAFILTHTASKKDGKLKLGKLSVALLPPGSSYKVLNVTYLVLTAVFLVALFAGAAGAYYALFAAAAYLFVTAVYFTVKLM